MGDPAAADDLAAQVFATWSIDDASEPPTAAADDLDGDGLAELVIGAPFAPCGGPGSASCGEVWIARPPYLGELGPDAASTTFTGGADLHLGGVLAPAGDTDGDGVRELWVTDVEVAHLVADDGQARALAVPDRAVTAEGEVIAAVLGGEDLDGDGLDDVVVATPTADLAWSDAGAVHVLHAPFAGLRSTLGASGTVIGEILDQGVGSSLGVVWDGLAIGALDPAGTGAGALHVVDRDPAGVVEIEGASVLTILGASITGEAGHDQAAGDFDGDGVEDLAIAEYDLGVWLVYGP